MSCADLFATLQMYVDGVTDEEETRLAAAHLAECAACRGRVEGWRRVVKSLEGLGPVRAPEGFADRVMDAVRRPAEREPARSFAAVGQEERSLNVSWTWAAAAVLMVGVGLVLWLGPEGSAAASAARGLLQFVASLFGR
ncbi:MAG: zf-HC2 domain-containing protein [Firmicutes bacterium]|nr:zf-HC2 domain-containing protein [Bacillota bacterium]